MTVPRGVLQGDPGVFGKIIGQRVGVAFTTPRLPPEESFGDWEGERDFDSVVQTFPRNVSLGDDGDTPWNAIGLRNLTEFEEIWADRGVSNLSAGTRFDCEPRLPWPCQVTARNGTGNGTIAFARLVEDGQTFLVDSFLGDRETAGGFSGSMRIADSAGGRFELRMEPDVGIMFQFREGFPPGIPPGTYRTVSIGDGVFTADYSPQAAVQPELIGRWSWYDIVVVSIGNDDAASAAG